MAPIFKPACLFWPHGTACVLTGRLFWPQVSGKNVEPQPIEDAVCGSPLIRHALLLGQDKRELGLLIFPDYDALEAALVAGKAAAGAKSAAAGAGAEVGLGFSVCPWLFAVVVCFCE